MIKAGLKNKVALITGVKNLYGIGTATAKVFAIQGATVFVTYLRRPAEDSATNIPGEAFYRAQNTKTADEVIAAIRGSGGDGMLRLWKIAPLLSLFTISPVKLIVDRSG
jgi:NAD(P)-dependent dehydrogenase (short-subunit alcohol dehydrogenase family)